jgi:5,6,7,8-tetrahydromethanopterin hydro-lyase
MAAFVTQLGEAFAGSGAEAAHVNTVLGAKGGPLEAAWATALATPSQGHVPFVAVVQPNLPVKPMTLFVNKASIAGDEHAAMTWGPAQAGVAGGVLHAVRDAVIDRDEVERLLLVVAVWVAPGAREPEAVFVNNRAATFEALRCGAAGEPDLDTVLAAVDEPVNAYFLPESLPPFR